MKKLISTLAATMLVATSLGAVSVSASEENMISLTTTVLDEAIIADNGAIIPAGTTAITVNIADNTGFSAKAIKLDVGNADIILDETGAPLVDKGEVIGDSIVGSAKNNDVMVLASASSEENNADGEIFTFYVSDYSADITITEINPQVEVENIVMPMAERYGYRLGDVNSDGYIDSSDASSVLSAIDTHQQLVFSDVLPVSTANANLSTYFPYHTPRLAEVADCNEDGYITSLDAQCIMRYYSAMATGGVPNVNTMGYTGEWRYAWL